MQRFPTCSAIENKDLAEEVNLLKPDDSEKGAEELYMEIADLLESNLKKGPKVNLNCGNLFIKIGKN